MKKIHRILFSILNWFILIVIGGTFFIVLAQQQDAAEVSIEGIWQGEWEVPGIELGIVFKISKEVGGNLVAVVDSPDQGVTGIPVEKVILEGHTLYLEVKSIGGFFEGKISEDFLIIDGKWKQAGQNLPLTMRKVDKTIEICRPQEPKKPYPYLEEEVFYENKEARITLVGTLTLPSSEGIFPVVLLITGSGPQDRNEFIAGHRPFLVLADYLTRQGIAVLRVDDRGVGKSTGDFPQATTEDFASDVLAGIEYLKNRKEINSKKIGLIGHSEGGIIAPMVAVKSPDVAFIVLMGGTGLNGEEILYLQSGLIAKRMGVSEEEIIKNRQINEKIFSVIKEGKSKEEIEKELRLILIADLEKLSEEEKTKISNQEEYIQTQLSNLLSPWFRFFLTYDPQPTLSKVKCPVLAIIGEKDLQVPPKENLRAIKEALQFGNNLNFTIQELPGLNHLFQTAQTGLPAEYAKIEETFSPLALKIISSWILQQAKDK